MNTEAGRLHALLDEEMKHPNGKTKKFKRLPISKNRFQGSPDIVPKPQRGLKICNINSMVLSLSSSGQAPNNVVFSKSLLKPALPTLEIIIRVSYSINHVSHLMKMTASTVSFIDSSGASKVSWKPPDGIELTFKANNDGIISFHRSLSSGISRSRPSYYFREELSSVSAFFV